MGGDHDRDRRPPPPLAARPTRRLGHRTAGDEPAHPALAAAVLMVGVVVLIVVIAALDAL